MVSLEKRMDNQKDEPVFPDSYDSIKKTERYEIIDGEIDNEEEFVRLVNLMFDKEEAKFFLYSRKDRGISDFLNAKAYAYDILFEITEMSYFEHPNFQRDFIKINKANPAWDWEKPVIENSPEYMRTTLKLTEKAKRELSAQRGNAVLLQPNFFGVGMDLRKVWPALKRKISPLIRIEKSVANYAAETYKQGKNIVSWAKNRLESSAQTRDDGPE